MRDNNLSLKNVTALILASGNAERLMSLNLDSPKCLIEFDGAPFIKYLMNWLHSQGIDRFVITTQEKHAPSVNEFVKSHAPPNTALVIEKTPTNTAHSTLIGLKAVSTPTTLLIVADSIFDIDLKAMHAFHKERNAFITALVSDEKELPNYPVLVSPGNQCLTMNNGGLAETNCRSASTIGLYFVDTDALLRVIEAGDTEINKEPMERLLPEVYAFWNTGSYFDFGTPDRLKWLQKHTEFITNRFGSI